MPIALRLDSSPASLLDMRMRRLPVLIAAFVRHGRPPKGKTNPELNEGNIIARRTFVYTDANIVMLINAERGRVEESSQCPTKWPSQPVDRLLKC